MKEARKTLQKKRRLDIRDVAERAKVSVATVSRTINMVPSVDQKLAARVWKAIEELNYYPNTQARALVSGRSRLLGLIVSEITNPFFPELIQGFEDIAVEHGYEILVSSTNYDPKRMENCIRRMIERKVEGVAVMTFGIEEPMLKQLASRNVPLVLVDLVIDNPRVGTLAVDYRQGIKQAVQHLAALGHRKLGFISGPLHLYSARERYNAFLEARDSLGILASSDWHVEGDHTLEGGLRGFEEMRSRGPLPTAILCSNDMTAIGVLRAASSANISVPHDLSVIGYDDVHLAEFVTPPLTSIQMSRTLLAREAFDTLIKLAEPAEAREQLAPRRIPTALICRQSTSYPPGAMHGLATAKIAAVPARASGPRAEFSSLPER